MTSREMLVAARRRCGRSVPTIAKMLGCNTNTVYRFERVTPVRGAYVLQVPEVYQMTPAEAGAWLVVAGSELRGEEAEAPDPAAVLMAEVDRLRQRVEEMAHAG